MLKKLRWQLTILYLSAALGLVFAIGVGSYSLLQHYYQNGTDLALQYKMANQFVQYHMALPQDLVAAQQAWLASNPVYPTKASVSQKTSVKPSMDDEGENDRVEPSSEQETSYDDTYDGQLAAVFTLPLNSEGKLLSNPNPSTPPILQDESAYIAASQKGSDLRTISLPDGTRLRLLTYRTTSQQGPAYFQVGRLLTDEDRVLGQFLVGLLFLGGMSSVILGLISWWLSGRSLGPAQRAWDQQQMFIANASHELRTPLTLIRATSEYGLRNRPDHERIGLFSDIVHECDYMGRLVDDLLLLTRLDTHRLKLNRERIHLAQLLTEVDRQVEKLASEKGVRLVLGSVGGVIWGDQARVRQVLLILIDNALRYTQRGGVISLETRLTGKYWQIEVADTGCGIPSKHLPHIFERFYQVSRPGSDDVKSNGLGLSIAKGLVEVQSGSIHLDSWEGKGTRAQLSFPAAD